MSKTFTYELLIRESHLDTFGHVNNAAYVQIFEEARWDLITEAGYGFDAVKESQIGPVILAMDIKFKREVRNRERVQVTTRCLKFPGRIGWIEQVLTNEKGETAATGNFTFGLLDMRTRTLAAPPEAWKRAVGL